MMKKICFVCLGNICRSTMAEFVMKSLDDDNSLHIESRGTSNWEHGNPIHLGTQRILKKYDIPFDSSKTSMQILEKDLQDFDLILGMDEKNVLDLLTLSKGRWDEKIHLFLDKGVPDPWYTGDFEETYDLVSKGCRRWLTTLGK